MDKVTTTNKTRDYAVDIIKFIAVFIIINSHADKCYTHFSALATGGAIGDALFLFCSGYTLFLGKMTRFDNYYKRRINRIYPSVFAAVIMRNILVGGFKYHSISIFLGGEFIIAIMVYYIILYIIKKYFINKIPLFFFITAAVTLAAYWFFPYKYETGEKGLYGTTTLFRWLPYFGFMLLGAYIGKDRSKVKLNIKRDTVCVLGSVILFYAIQLAAKKIPAIAPWQILTLPFLGGTIYYAYKCANAECFRRLYDNKYGHWVVMAVGGLCLESYLIQHSVLSTKLNYLFPLNIPIMMLLVLIVAYITRCIARVLSQTFRTEDYEWKKVFSI